ncbi:DUF2147 domain-containing protein [Portibacter lacus]|uniref:DUF2147 domain-containing protein n=1 Tax=Portibacter lacus TaxID=1099794 RepID=A0AA37SWG9_9BACT|nr:DUF2147 domain-containing protein [Portibacter lacus]GLR18995.1 hypothetical protein GCM10007940_36110 [Portibacter lacus]
MKKISFLFAFFFAVALSAQSPIGIWKTIDDESGEPKSHVEIYEKDGKIFGKVVKLLPKATTDVCIDCPGDLNGKSLLEMDIIWDLEEYKDYWSYGHIIDPANGKEYKLSIWLEDADTLKVRGYIGISALGRNQMWYRVK